MGFFLKKKKPEAGPGWVRILSKLGPTRTQLHMKLLKYPFIYIYIYKPTLTHFSSHKHKAQPQPHVLLISHSSRSHSLSSTADPSINHHSLTHSRLFSPPQPQPSPENKIQEKTFFIEESSQILTADKSKLSLSSIPNCSGNSNRQSYNLLFIFFFFCVLCFVFCWWDFQIC